MSRTREKVVIGLAVGITLSYFGSKYLSAKRLKQLPTELVGTWRSNCTPAGGTHPSPHQGYVVLDSIGNYEATYIYYQTATCQKADMLNVFTGPLSVYEPNGSGLRDISWGIKSISYAMLSQRSAALANKHSLHGFTEWRVNEPKAMEIVKRTYDIMKIENAQLFFGDSASGDMTAPNTRPEKLELQGYTKIVTPVPTSLALAIGNAAPCIQNAYALAGKIKAMTGKYDNRTATVQQRKGHDLIKARFNSSVQSSKRCLDFLCKRKDYLACQVERGL